MVRSFLAVLTVFVASAVPARADLLRPFFADFGTCYARHYDKAHMRGHPRQNVTAIYLSNTVQQLAGEDRFVLDFGFVTRDGEHYSAEAYCDTRDRRRPFFLFLHSYDAHHPYLSRPEIAARVPGAARGRYDVQRFCREASPPVGADLAHVVVFAADDPPA